MARDVAEPSDFSSFHYGQEGFLWSCLQCDLIAHKVVCLPLMPGDAEQTPEALGLKRLDSPGGFCCQCPGFAAVEQDRQNQGLEQF